jgi:expansin (peptidoglycan-binding protein)
MPGGGDISNNFSQYSNGIADASYAFDFVGRVTIASLGIVTVTFPVQANVIRIRNVIITDVTAALGGVQAALVAAYFRIDGNPIGTGGSVNGSFARVLKPGSTLTVARWVPQEAGVTLYNPNGANVIVQVELGA